MKKKLKFLSALLLVFVFMLTPFVVAGCSLVEEVTPPSIEISDDGYWVINGEKTEVKAGGQKGDSPYIGEDGYWYIGNEKTLYKAQGDPGNGIVSILKSGTEGTVDTYTITYSDGTTSTFNVNNGSAGSPGSTGNGIASVAKTGTQDNVDTYTITFTNGSTQTFTVTNGVSGAKGVGIKKIELTDSDENVDTYTITFTDETLEPFEFTVTNGINGTTPADGRDGTSVTQAEINENGALIITLSDGTTSSQINAGNVKGDDGNGIAGIAKIDDADPDDNIDTYRITFTNNETFTFQVVNGVDATYATYEVSFNYHGTQSLFDFTANDNQTVGSIQIKTTEWLKGKLPELKEEFKGFLLGWYIRGTNIKLGDYNFVGGDVTLEPIFNFNALLNALKQFYGKHDTLQDVVDDIRTYTGIDLVEYDAAFDTDYTRLVWDSVNDQLYLFVAEENEIDTLKAIQTEEATELDAFTIYHEDDYDIDERDFGEGPVAVVDLTGERTAVYLAPNDALEGVIIYTNKGIDVGENANIAEVKYENEYSAQTVTIRTNGGVLTINGPYDTVHKFGTAETVNIISVASTSYHEFGTTGLATIAEGRFVVTEDAQVGGVHVVATSVENGEPGEKEFKPVILTAEVNAAIPSITRDDFTIEDGERKQVFKIEQVTLNNQNEEEVQTAFVYIAKDAGVESAVVTVLNNLSQEVELDLTQTENPEIAAAAAIATAVEVATTAEAAAELSPIKFVSTEEKFNEAVENGATIIYISAEFTQTGLVTLNREIKIVGQDTSLKATISGTETIELVNIRTTEILVQQNGFSGTLIFDGGLIETNHSGTGDEDAAFYSRNNPDATFVFKNMEIAANITKGIKIYQAANVIIDNCNFDATKLDAYQEGNNSAMQSLSLVDIQIRGTCTGTNITITNSYFGDVPQGKTAVPTGTLEDSDTGAAIKLKVEGGAQFGSVTIEDNTFVNNYRDIVVGTAAYANQFQMTASAAGNGRSAEGLQYNTIGTWTIENNTTTLDLATIESRGVATLSYVGGPSGFDKFTTRVGNVGELKGGCGIWTIGGNLYEKINDTWYYKDTDGTYYSVATGANYSVTLTQVSATVETEEEFLAALADESVVYIQLVDDIELADKIDFGRDVVIDLGDNTITFASYNEYLIKNAANKNVTIKNGTISYTSSVTVSAISDFIRNYGNMTLDGVDLELNNIYGSGTNNINAVGNWGQGEMVIKDSIISIEALTTVEECMYKPIGVWNMGRRLDLIDSTVNVYGESLGSIYGVYNYINPGETTAGTRIVNISGSTINTSSTRIDTISGVFAESYEADEAIINIGEGTVINSTRLADSGSGKNTYALRAKGNATINGASNAELNIVDPTDCTQYERGAETTGVIND